MLSPTSIHFSSFYLKCNRLVTHKMRISSLLSSLQLVPFAIIAILVLVPAWSYEMNHDHAYQTSSLVPTPSSLLTYHKGLLLSGPRSINIYILWYGAFSPIQKTAITDFFASFNPSMNNPNSQQKPTVFTWWKTTQSYKDLKGTPVSSTVRLVGQTADANYSLGKSLKRAHIALLIKRAIDNKLFLQDSNAIYLVLTAPDVSLERFCMGSCGFHDSLLVSPKQRVVYAHVGDPGIQCPSLCAWPYAAPAYGPPGQALRSPNGVGTDGMIMNVATILAGAATNPFKNGYFQGDPLAPLEAVTACPGIFGAGAYPGYPGKLMVNGVSKASFNAYGAGGKVFLLPAMWDLTSNGCKFVA